MPLPAIIGPIVSILAWVGIDLGLSKIMGSDDVAYVRGLDFPSFMEIYWPAVLIYALLVIMGLWIAFPKNNGRVNRNRRR